MKDVSVDLRGALRSTDTMAAGGASRLASRRACSSADTLAALSLAAALFLLFDGRRERAAGTPPGGASGKPSVAVLYFENASSTPNLEWMRTGLTEMVVTELSQSQDIEVVATEQLFEVLASLKRSDNRQLSPDMVRAVAERTGVTNVVVGSYIKSGNMLRINVRLQEAQSGRIISSERVEGTSEQQLFAMVDDLSRRLLKRLDNAARRRAGDRRGDGLCRRRHRAAATRSGPGRIRPGHHRRDDQFHRGLSALRRRDPVSRSESRDGSGRDVRRGDPHRSRLCHGLREAGGRGGTATSATWRTAIASPRWRWNTRIV